VEQKIFEPFFTTKPTGTGLGLAISRSIIKAHDARLGYRANQPRGACFYFVLPAHHGDAAMKDLPQTVYVVDDDDAVRDSLRLLLKSAGLACEVSEPRRNSSAATTGRTRLPGARRAHARHERARDAAGAELRGAIIPVIFITGHGDIPMAVEAMQHGAFDFLQKPFRDQELLDRVQRALVRDTENRVAAAAHGSHQGTTRDIEPARA
jgi:CheY-like chemotaxis protein